MKRSTAHNSLCRKLELSACSLVRVFLYVAVSFLFIAEAQAVALGELTVRSALGQPLKAEVELLYVDNDELDNVHVGLADVSVFTQLNIPRLPLLSDLKFRTVSDRRTKPYVAITSIKPVNEPFLNLLLQLESPDGALVNEIVILLDPLVEGTNTSNGTTSEMARSASSAGTTPPRTGAATRTRNYADQIRVRSGDSLLTIVRRLRLGRATGAQASVAIYEANPQAFVGSIHHLEVGSVLTIPNEREMLAYSQSAALNLLKNSLPASARARGGVRQPRQARAFSNRNGQSAEALAQAKLDIDRLSVLTETGIADPGAVVLISNESLGDIKALIVNLQGSLYELQGEFDERIEQLEALNARVDELISVADQIVTVAPDVATTNPEVTRSLTVEEARKLLLVSPRFESVDQSTFDAKKYSEQEKKAGSSNAAVDGDVDEGDYLRDLEDLERRVGNAETSRDTMAAFVTARRHGRDFLPNERFGERSDDRFDNEADTTEDGDEPEIGYGPEAISANDTRWEEIANAISEFRDSRDTLAQARPIEISPNTIAESEISRDDVGDPGIALETQSSDGLANNGVSVARQRETSSGLLKKLPKPLQDILPSMSGFSKNWQRVRDIGFVVIAAGIVLWMLRRRSPKVAVATDAVPANMDPDEALDFYMNQIGNDELKEEVLKSFLKDSPDRQDVRLQLLSMYTERREAGLFAETAQEMYRMTKGKNEEWHKVVEMGLALDPNMRFYEGTNVIRFDLEADLGLTEEDRVESIRGGTSPGSQPYAVANVSFDDFQPTDAGSNAESSDVDEKPDVTEEAGPDIQLDEVSMAAKMAEDNLAPLATEPDAFNSDGDAFNEVDLGDQNDAELPQLAEFHDAAPEAPSLESHRYEETSRDVMVDSDHTESVALEANGTADIDLSADEIPSHHIRNADELLTASGQEIDDVPAEISYDRQLDAESLLVDGTNTEAEESPEEIVMSYTQGTMELDFNLDLETDSELEREMEVSSRRISNLVEDGEVFDEADLTASSLQSELSILENELDSADASAVDLLNESIELELDDDEQNDELSESQQWLGKLRSNLAGAEEDEVNSGNLNNGAVYADLENNEVDDIEADLETAMAYISNGFFDDAKPLLGKVLVHGNGEQRDTASRLIDEIDGNSKAGLG